MPKYRKRPIVVEAVRVFDVLVNARVNWGGLPVWIVDAYEAGKLLFMPSSVSVITPEGLMLAQQDDWLISGVQGEVYPCKPDIFKLTYEEVQ